MNKVTLYIMCLFLTVLPLCINAQESTRQQTNRSQLIQQTANVCLSGNTDETTCSVLVDAALDFGIHELEEYATLLRNRQLDIQDKKVIAATTALLARAETLFGKESMEAAKCRRACLVANNTMYIDKAMKLSDENVIVTKKIYEKDKTNWKNEEFYYLCRLENMLLKECTEVETPLLYAEAYEIELKTDSLYKIHEEDSEERMLLYNYMAYMKPTYTNYSNYLNIVYHKLFPNDTRIPSLLYNDSVISNALGYFEESAKMAHRMFGDDDMRTLDAETNLQRFKCNNNIGLYDEAYVKLKDVERRMKMQLHPDDTRILYVRMAQWECDIRAEKRLNETDGYQDYLNKMKVYFGEYSRPYLFVLYDVLWQRQCVDVNQALSVLDEIKKIANVIYHDDNISLAHTYALTAEAAMGQGDSSVANQHISKIDMALYKSIEEIKVGKTPLTWKAVWVARRLREIYSMVFYKEQHLKVGLHLIDMEQSLAKHVPLVYSGDLLGYSNDLAFSEKYDEALQLCSQVKDIMQSDGLSSSRVYYDILNVYDIKRDTVLYEKTLREAVKETDGDVDWNCYFKLMLASYIYTTPEGKAMMEEAYKTFLANEDNISGIFFEEYFIINNYLQRNNCFKDAETLLLRGLERYNSLDGSYGDVFVRFLTEIVGLYRDQNEDYDKAESFLEGHLQNLIGNPTNINHETTLQMLWMHYNLLTVKSDNDTKILYLLQLMLNEANAICNQVNDEDMKKRLNVDYTLPIVYEYINYYIPQFENFEKEIDKVSFNSSYAQYKKAAIDKINELKTQMEKFNSVLIEMDEYFKTIYPNYINMFEYVNLINAASTLLIYFDKDLDKAETWLKKGLKSTDKAILCRVHNDLAGLYMKKEDYANAVKHYKEMMRMADELQDISLNSRNKANFNYKLSYALYKSKQYDNAIGYAMTFYHLRLDLLKRNINLMTQTEREEYLGMYGVGGMPLHTLLPHAPQRLSADVYNSILLEKGFLLRASERIQNAILNSGSAELKSELDSLNIMNEKLKKLALVKTDYSNFQTEYNKETLRLQQQKEQLERNINREVKKIANIEDETVTWNDVRKVLGQKDIAVEFVLSDSVLGALIVKKDSDCPQYVQLCSSMSINKWLSDNAGMDARERAEALYMNDVLGLYSKIWQPMEKYLDGVEHIYFSPSSFLNLLSLGAVRCPDGTCMMDHYIVHQLTSTAQLVKSVKSNPSTKKQAALYGAVYYSEEQKQDDDEIIALQKQKAVDMSKQLTAQREVVGESFAFLPFTRSEVTDLEGLLKSYNVDCKAQFGQQASEQQFRQMSGNSPYILHLATHGFFVDTEDKVMQNVYLSQFPAMRFHGMQRAGMALVGANKTWEEGNSDTENDGILTAAEVSALNLDNTRLAVLSACNTGVGFYSEEGVYGMYRGFKQAGVKSVLSSLWTVNDYSTSKLMQLFYTKWMGGMSMQQAYQQAVSEIRRDFPSPYYWAPFVLIDAVE